MFDLHPADRYSRDGCAAVAEERADPVDGGLGRPVDRPWPPKDRAGVSDAPSSGPSLAALSGEDVANGAAPLSDGPGRRPTGRPRTRLSTVVVPVLAGEVMAGLGRVVLLRRRAYEVLGLAFRPPQAWPVARVLRDAPFVLEQVLAVAPFQALQEAYRLLSDLAAHPAAATALYRDLALEYGRLFDTPDGAPAGPCECRYRERGASPAAADDIRTVYRVSGFSSARVIAGPPDHVAVELAYMAELCRRQFRALAENAGIAADRLAETQRQFLEDHLRPWLPAFAQDVRARTTSDFYRAAALALPVWLGLDRGFLQSLLAAEGAGT